MAVTAEVADFLKQRLAKVPSLSGLTLDSQDEDSFVIAQTPTGEFLIYLWSEGGGFLRGAQVFARPKGRPQHLHLGYWHVRDGIDGTLSEVTDKLWETLAEQDAENRELERYGWLPVRKLPRVQELTLFAPPVDPKEDIEGLVTDLFGV